MAAHKNTFHRHLFTRFLQLVLLLGITALPSLAFAVDTDGDGMPDSINTNMLPIIFADSFEGAAQPGWTGIVVGTPQSGSWRLSTDQAHSGSGSLAAWLVGLVV